MNVQNLVKVNGPLGELRTFLEAEARNFRFRDGAVFFETDSEWVVDVERIRALAVKYPELRFRVVFLDKVTNYRGVATFANREFRLHEDESDLKNVQGPLIPQHWLEDFEPPLDDYFETV